MIPEHDWIGIGMTVLGIVIPMGLQQWWLHKQNADAIKKRDAELHLILGEYPLHRHDERDKAEVLTVDGIRYPNAKLNGH